VRQALVFALLSSPLAAGQLSYSSFVAPTAVPFTTTVSLPQFDPALGFLRSAELRCSAGVLGTIGLENLSGTGSLSLEFTPIAMVTTSCNGVNTLAANPAWETSPYTTLLPFDGNLDYAGISGATFTIPLSYGSGAPTQQAIILNAATLALFSSAPSTPGSVTVSVDAWDATQITGYPDNPPPNYSALLGTAAQAMITITYNYDGTGAKFCGTGLTWNPSPCPCGNAGQFANGCGNSFNAAGASLDVVGTASLSADSVALNAAGLTNGLTIFVQTDAYQYPGATYGDGVKCFSGNLVRLGQRLPAAGAATYPTSPQQPVSVRGQVLQPGPRYYTATNRNAASYCTPDTFNATNSVAIYWQP
jgi:hypothetical protein